MPTHTPMMQRRIVTRTSGQRHGPITRLMSPNDLGALLKPFVFLDHVNIEGGAGPQFGFHPHSGIATLTYPLTFDIQHQTSSGQTDIVRRGGIEWMVAGAGIWHRATPLNTDAAQGFQVWFALPPAHEHQAPSASFIQAREVPVDGPVTVLLGQYGQAISPIQAPIDANYFWVQLNNGQSWHYQPPISHDLAWTFARTGTLQANDERLHSELAMFEAGHDPITFTALGDCTFLLGSAAQHPYHLVLGPHSVHTSREALHQGLQRIAALQPTLPPQRP
ncbi:pirin family protein [Limnohabitans sp. JirII-31]|uniref:pirin family protein n=1 Tax=Limnohabitans sp. JirII-31 TaxID=1977908 RepID=UPI000C1E2273|nr:pirin family protein [Limnohabitans sp. JirII-31]PIT79691.1 hypothetical protein B9Z41_03640 [Limnohabitans sp. JirII-31]